jgi:hypothetical protein
MPTHGGCRQGMGKTHTHEIRKVARVKKPEVGGKRAHKPSANLQERRSTGTSGKTQAHTQSKKPAR